MNPGSWIKRILFLTLIATLPLLFTLPVFILFKIPVWDIALPVSGLVSGIGTALIVAVLVKKYFTVRVSTEPEKAKKYLLYLALLTGFGFPLVLFIIAGLIYMVRAGMPPSQVLEVGWVSFVAGAAWGWPMWLFSVPWAFVMVYGLANAQVSSSGVQVPGKSLHTDERDG